MELLQLLLYTTAFSQLSYSTFIDLCFINIFIKYAYNYKPTEYSHIQTDFSTFFITFTHIMLHIINFYVYVFYNKFYTYEYGKYIIDNYNLANRKYLNLRAKIIYYVFLIPFKFILKKTVFSNIPEQDISNFKKMINLNYSNNIVKKQYKINDSELKTNKQIDSFLDKILSENNKNK